MGIMVTIRHGTSRTITVLTGGRTVDIVHIPALVTGATMATAMPRMTLGIDVTVAVKMRAVKNTLPAMIVV